jgi:hypothetical protein
MLRAIVLTVSFTCLAVPSTAQTALRDPLSFTDITDQAARSRALFSEAAKVITSPRCMNCHPADDHPTQGNDMHAHLPAVTRGVDGGGFAGNRCQACHTNENYTLLEGASYKSIPGHPRWMVAPIEMAWQGKSVTAICQQLKDPARNGGRTLELVHEHLAQDDLVGWGWEAGAGREPPPGSQRQLGELIRAWIDTGAQCP